MTRYGLSGRNTESSLWRGSGGFSLFEFAVVSIVLSLVSLFFFDRLLTYQEMAEKTAAEITAINMRTGLRYRVAEMLLHHQEREIATLVGANPVKWLDTLPPNYSGEMSAPKWEEIPPGNWYFDVKKREILYRVKKGRYFVPGPSGRRALRFRITASLKPAESDPSILLAEGVTLTLVEPYKWF